MLPIRPPASAIIYFVKYLRILAPLAALLLTACSKNIQTNEAVREAVIKHVSQNKGLQISSMDIEVTSVTFRDDQAEVVVSFRPKGGDASSGMQIPYTLEKKGSEWVVKKKTESGMGHGTAATPPAGMPPAGAQMPPSHPPVDSGKMPGTKK